MINNKDLYIHKETKALTDGKTQIGTLINQYEVKKYVNLQNLEEKNSYIVSCTQRIIIPNNNQYHLKPEYIKSYIDYPALLSSSITIDTENDLDNSYYLLSYNPKTLNTAVMSDKSSSDSSGESYSHQHTSGSSTSQTNSYGGSVNLSPMGGVSADYQHSSTTSQEDSNSRGSSNDVSNQNSSSDSMSIKDWGSYAITDLNNQVPTWIWGQEYPWNVMNCRNIRNGGGIAVPSYVQSRLLYYIKDENQFILYPPSQLSLFGINFVSQASWIVKPSNNYTKSQLSFVHKVNYYVASHYIESEPGNSKNTFVAASMKSPLTNPINISSDSLDLASLALDPIQKSAATGFIPNQFTVPPSSGNNFEIASSQNNLLIRGTGFTKPMFTDFSAKEVSLNIYFKITSSSKDYTLFMKCWKTTATDCLLNITINGDTSNVIVKSINDLEFAGGENNLVSVNLRNKDYTSADYYDYLKLGLNNISIKVTAASTGAGFILRTLAIG